MLRSLWRRWRWIFFKSKALNSKVNRDTMTVICRFALSGVREAHFWARHCWFLRHYQKEDAWFYPSSVPHVSKATGLGGSGSVAFQWSSCDRIIKQTLFEVRVGVRNALQPWYLSSMLVTPELRLRLLSQWLPSVVSFKAQGWGEFKFKFMDQTHEHTYPEKDWIVVQYKLIGVPLNPQTA